MSKRAELLEEENRVWNRAADIIGEDNWTRRWYAADKTGARISPFDENARYFCVTGAVRKAVDDEGCPDREDEFLRLLGQEVSQRTGANMAAAHWNDTVCESPQEAANLLRGMTNRAGKREFLEMLRDDLAAWLADANNIEATVRDFEMNGGAAHEHEYDNWKDEAIVRVVEAFKNNHGNGEEHG